MTTKCLACGNSAHYVGDFLPFTSQYLEHEWVQKNVDLQAGRLYCCPTCDLWFRSPYATEQTLAKLYAGLPHPSWSQPIDKDYWQTIRHTIKQYGVGKKVLDVGCYMGDFLSFLDADYEKFGIEPSQIAQNVAKEKGITILGSTIETTQLTPESLDVVVMLDVLEHIQQPIQVITNYHQALTKGGILVIATGATETTFFNWFKQYYWYATISMHCLFYSLKWFRWLTTQLPFEIIGYEYFSAGEKISSYLFAKQLLIKCLYIFYQKNKTNKLVQQIYKLPFLRLIPPLFNTPWLISAKDQLLIFLKK